MWRDSSLLEAKPIGLHLTTDISLPLKESVQHEKQKGMLLQTRVNLLLTAPCNLKG